MCPRMLGARCSDAGYERTSINGAPTPNPIFCSRSSFCRRTVTCPWWFAPCSRGQWISCQSLFNSQQFLDRVNAAIKHDLEAREKRYNARQLAQGLVLLTARRREILEPALSGESSKRIANALKISHKTVEAHRAHIMKKLNVRSFNEIIGKIFGKLIGDALHAIQ